MRKKVRRLLGSSRGGHFREPRKRFRSSERKRRQSVRFRKRYAKSVMQKYSGVVWNVARVVFVAAVVIWGVAMAGHFIRQGKFLEIKKVSFDGDVPTSFPASFPVQQKQNILTVKPAHLAAESLKSFPELESVSVARAWNRHVNVRLKARVPLALTLDRGEQKGVDKEGIIFPLDTVERTLPQRLIKIQAPSTEVRRKIINMLQRFEKELPEFYARLLAVRNEELDMIELDVEPTVKIKWGAIDEKNMIEKAKNILRCWDMYTPRGEAMLKFVNGDRIVLDANWAKVTSTKGRE